MLNIKIFDRVIRDCPIPIEVSEHNNPVKSFGIRGSGKDGFLQPVAIAIDKQNDLVRKTSSFYISALGLSKKKLSRINSILSSEVRT